MSERRLAEETLTVGPNPFDPDGRTVRTAEGEVLEVPAGWELLPPGDAGATRRVKSGGAHWVVQLRKGRRTFSRGVWAPASRIERARLALMEQRVTPQYARRKAADKQRRDDKQAEYVETFADTVRRFLDFAPRYAELGEQVAAAIATHATPVGSGTVARTERIPVEQRAEAATIAWLRHQTTAYDHLAIPRVKGQRRQVRRELARQSRALLATYRKGERISPRRCPLRLALARLTDAP